MKAIVYSRFGPPEVLQLKEIQKPTPMDNEVRIKIHAAAVSVEDPGMRAYPGLNGFLRPRRPILGAYLAGEIESIGQAVRCFREGDQVYGATGMSYGAYAQYKCMPEDGALATKPAYMSYEEAVAVPNGGLTALPFLRDKGRIRSGHQVLINGASGAVGTSAVQLAKSFGAHVTGVCSTANLELVQFLGADQVIDYTQQDFAEDGQAYDIILDTVGNTPFTRCKGLLKHGGVYLSTVLRLSTLLQTVWTSRIGSKRAVFMSTGLRPAREKAQDLVLLTELAEAGKLKAVIDRCYPMKQIAEAHRYVARGHKKGNVVITVAHDLIA